MVCLDHSSILQVDQRKNSTKFKNSTGPCCCLKSRRIDKLKMKKNMPNSQNQLNIPACQQSRSALIDVMILIAVIGACGVLMYPYVTLLVHKLADFLGTITYVVTDEIFRAPVVYISLGFSILFAAIALLVITVCIDRRCGKPGCRGLRKAAEFDIQLETEDCVKNSNCVTKNGVKKGLFELPRDHHQELEAELKKMAPPNGRAVLVFRGRCGCSVGRMEVPGPRKPRKVKK